MADTVQQQIAAGEEVRTAVRLIHAGIDALHEISGVNDFYALPLMTLCSGFERLMKITLCFRVHAETGRFPPTSYLKRHGHSLDSLLGQIQATCVSGRCEATPIVREDLDFLTQDEHLQRLIHVLSRFGEATRYFNLNVVTGKSPSTDSPDREWERLETEILQDTPGWEERMRSGMDLDDTYSKINQEIASKLERFARALARLYTHGDLGPLARQWGNPVLDFAILKDEDLGVRRT